MSSQHFQRAMEFIEDSKRAKSLDELASAFRQTIGDFGFDYFACVSSVDFGDRPEGAVFLANYPDDWTSYYIENKLEQTDPVQRFSVNQHMPFNWGDERIQQGITEDQIDVMHDAADAGLVYGVTVPIQIVGAFPGAVTVVGKSKTIDPEIEHSVHLMALYLHDAAMRLDRPLDVTKVAQMALTPREKECLKWVAQGKTDWEIAEILTISERTAHSHIENAKKKLGVTTRLQAVVKTFLTNLLPY